MPDPVRITLLPLGHEFTVERGTKLQDVLFTFGVEFPCGGRAICEGCKIKVLSGELALTPEQEMMLSKREVAEGWRLACQCRAEEDVTLELAQWEAQVLSDESRLEVEAREGYGIAIDLGTTTIAVQLLDLTTGNVAAIETALNEQGRYGADVMSRISHAVTERRPPTLESIIRQQLGHLVDAIVRSAGVKGDRVVDIVIVGNTVMHHLFSGLDVTPLSQYPFESPHYELQRFGTEELGWRSVPNATVWFLPAMGSFVGSDILAGILATNIYKSDPLVGLVDLGTNGEIVIGNKEKLLYCSTAAGPAFEGSCISMGMRATTGAIAQVVTEDGGYRCRVLGNVIPRGICGSGLVDAVAAGLQTKHIREDGKIMTERDVIDLCPPVVLNQSDIRELQVAKAAIAAGIRILTANLGASLDDLSKVYLAGAFGNYVDRSNAYRIGLLPVQAERIQPAGNSALLGAKLALFDKNFEVLSSIRKLGKHVALNMDEKFQETFIWEMPFPENDGGDHVSRHEIV
jgi:uncharacterized 2Fe-2S/4Fe-4S cluster protein (DUF4445 family)